MQSDNKKVAAKTFTENFNKQLQSQSKETTLPFWKEILFELIQKRHYSASQIAHRSGISKTIVHKLLKGITHNLSYRNFRKLLRLYFAVCYDLNGKKIEYDDEKKN